MFCVGDDVVYIGEPVEHVGLLPGMTGRVVDVHGIDGSFVYVVWDEHIEGHNLHGACGNRQEFGVGSYRLSRIKNEQYEEFCVDKHALDNFMAVMNESTI